MKKKIYLKGLVKAQKGAGTFEVIASTSVIDRQGESIDQSGWELDNFLKNPVMLWAHNYGELPVGVAEQVEVNDTGLVIKGRFADGKANPKAEQIRLLYEDEILKTVSVGFIPKERNGNIITKAELLEVSFVPVPANPEALSLALAKGFDASLFDEKGTPDDDEDDDDEDDVNATKPTICEPDSPDYDPQACGAIFCNPDSPDYNQDFCDLMEAIKTQVETKAGRVLSQKNRDLIQNAINQFKQSITVMQELLDATEPAKNGIAPSGEHLEKERSKSVDGLIEMPVETLKELLSHTRTADKLNELSNTIIKRVLKGNQN